MLDERPFAVYTIHKHLTFALSRATDAWTPRQGRHLSCVTEFTADIRYIPGKENVVADTLSRPPRTAHAAGPDSSSHTAGPDSCSHTAGPDSCSHTAGPDSSSHTAGPDSWYEERAAGLNSLDRSTRWLEAIPLRDMSAAACADALIGGWVSRFGVPSLITSDRGTQFTSTIWEALCSKLGVKHTTTTAYHPQSNGLVERAHRQLKEALKSRLEGAAWPDHLPWALLGLRAAPKDDSNISSAELVLPGEFLDAAEPPAAEFLEHMRSVPTSIPTRPLPPPASADPGATPTGQLGVRAARRDDAAAHAAVCWPIRGTRARGEDLPHPDWEQVGQGVSG
jgi:hypothetical protein